jgi:hypothetical protein
MMSADNQAADDGPPFDEDFDNHLNLIADWLRPISGGICMPWPDAERPSNLRHFATSDQWLAAIQTLDLDPASAAPGVVRAKYRRAQKLYSLAWLDGDIIKAGELAAFTALELALVNRFGPDVDALKSRDPAKPRKKRPPRATGRLDTPPLPDLLDYLVTHRGLTDADLPTACGGGGTAVDRLRRVSDVGPPASRPTLSETRNSLAHGDPFDGLPIGGLLHLVRDLIHFTYSR